MAAESPSKKARTEDSETYYKVIDGEKYDKKLLEEAEAFANDGQISYPEAKKLVESAQDGKGITDVEKATLKYAIEKLQCSAKAKNFLEVTLKDPSSSYYKQIDGKKYDRELLDAAEVFAADGQISNAEAKDLIKLAEDGKGVTEIETETLKYICGKYKFTDKAKNTMEVFLGAKEAPSRTGSYYKQIDGVKYDRELLESAEVKAKDGQISYQDAKDLLENAKDGKGITATEKATLEYTLANIKYTDKARKFMTEELGLNKKGSYYVQIDGVQYDKELLEKAQASVKDGQISDAEAKQLFEDAKDGPGITACEKRTLEHTLKTMKYTDKAKEWMTAALAGPLN